MREQAAPMPEAALVPMPILHASLPHVVAGMG
jgi:hypothetical protein